MPYRGTARTTGSGAYQPHHLLTASPTSRASTRSLRRARDAPEARDSFARIDRKPSQGWPGAVTSGGRRAGGRSGPAGPCDALRQIATEFADLRKRCPAGGPARLSVTPLEAVWPSAAVRVGAGQGGAAGWAFILSILANVSQGLGVLLAGAGAVLAYAAGDTFVDAVLAVCRERFSVALAPATVLAEAHDARLDAAAIEGITGEAAVIVAGLDAAGIWAVNERLEAAGGDVTRTRGLSRI